MKSFFIVIFIFFPIFSLSSQNITPEQDAVIFDLSKKSSKIIADDIFTEFLFKKSDNYNINIVVEPATNAMGKITTFGVFYSKSLVSEVQSILNSGIIKKYNYNLYSSEVEIKDNSLENYTLKISYIFKNSSLVISKISLSTVNQTISLKSFETTGNIDEIRSLDEIAKNTIYNKIFELNANNNLFDSLVIYDFNKNIIVQQNNNCNLQTNTDYKFRFFLKPYTFLYVFYYEPEKSNFYFIYPISKNDNKKLTYKIKDVQKISFSNIDFGKIKIIVSNQTIEINNLIDNNLEITPEQAEIIYKEISKKSDNLSTYNLNINF